MSQEPNAEFLYVVVGKSEEDQVSPPTHMTGMREKKTSPAAVVRANEDAPPLIQIDWSADQIESADNDPDVWDAVDALDAAVGMDWECDGPYRDCNDRCCGTVRVPADYVDAALAVLHRNPRLTACVIEHETD